MTLSVKQMLTLDLFKQCKVAAGKNGLENEIFSVDVLEVPEYI